MEEEKWLFFSVVVPAHNEAHYIRETLDSLRQVDYPADRYEVIVVENGSTDQTWSVIQGYRPAFFQSEHLAEVGVSPARNRGAQLVSPQCDWVIFLDADTTFKPPFLKELNAFLQANAGKNLGSGMVSLLPSPNTPRARAWYHFYNAANCLTLTTRSIQIVRRDVLDTLHYDEKLAFGEDTKLMYESHRMSRHFYLRTRSVSSSTRRFQKNGWWGQLFRWIYQHFLPYRKKVHVNYPVIR